MSAPAGDPDASPVRVLVADDDPILRLVAAQLLEEAGYAYVLAEDGQQALDLA